MEFYRVRAWLTETPLERPLAARERTGTGDSDTTPFTTCSTDDHPAVVYPALAALIHGELTPPVLAGHSLWPA